MTFDHPPLSAAVLAGGKSERMGRDKAFLPLWDNGPSMLEMVLHHMRRVADDLLIVANDPERFAGLGLRVVPDKYPGLGALAGIHAGVSSARHDHCLVVACDMPFLQEAFLRRMAEEPRTYDILIPQVPGESRQGNSGLVFQTLHAIYGKQCLPAMARQLSAGQKQVIRFFPEVRVRVLDLPEIASFDPNQMSFFNANTPEAYDEARSFAAREHLYLT